jgi:hypothetical protein
MWSVPYFHPVEDVAVISTCFPLQFTKRIVAQLGANLTQRRAFELAIIQSTSEFKIPHLRYQSIIIILGGNIY